MREKIGSRRGNLTVFGYMKWVSGKLKKSRDIRRKEEMIFRNSQKNSTLIEEIAIQNGAEEYGVYTESQYSDNKGRQK